MTDLYNGTISCILLVGDKHSDILQMSFRHQKFKKNFINVHLVSAEIIFNLMPASSTLTIQSGHFTEIVWTCSDVGSYF
jgi:hypothetical protein